MIWFKYLYFFAQKVSGQHSLNAKSIKAPFRAGSSRHSVGQRERMQWHKELPDLLREQKNGEEHQHSQQSRTSQECFSLSAHFLHPCVKATFPQKLSSYPCSLQPRLQEGQLGWGPVCEFTQDSNVAFIPQIPPIPPIQQSYDCEIPQGRAARFATQSNSSHKDAPGIYSQKTLFSLKFLYSLLQSKWNQKRGAHTWLPCQLLQQPPWVIHLPHR